MAVTLQHRASGAASFGNTSSALDVKLQLFYGCTDSEAPPTSLQVRSVPIRKDDEVMVVRGTYKVRYMSMFDS